MSSQQGASLAAECLATGKELLITPEHALHVLEIMAAVTSSSDAHAVVELTTTVDRPEAVPEGADPATW